MSVRSVVRYGSYPAVMALVLLGVAAGSDLRDFAQSFDDRLWGYCDKLGNTPTFFRFQNHITYVGVKRVKVD